jgi:hypothetical protein
MKPDVYHSKSSSLQSESVVSKIYQILLKWTGFSKLSSLVLFFLSVGIFAIFSAFQMRTLEEGNRMKPNPPGGPFWFREGILRLAMQVHLWSVIRKSSLEEGYQHVMY